MIRVYEKTAAREGFRFFGNVKVGHDIEVEDLERLYHAIVFTVGCETDRQLGIPGEDLPGSHAATAFVGWYNAHPDYCDEEFDLSCERAVVIGNGNVAMDVARMLALTDHELRQTDTADHAIEAARREARSARSSSSAAAGPAQAAFTNPEIKELGEMEDADVIVDPAEVELDPASQAYLESDEADKTTRVNVEILREFSQREPEGKRQRIVLRFLASPVEIKGDGKVEKIVIGRNELVEEGGTLRAQDTGEREELECGLVLRSVGYTGVPIEGVPFDEKRGLILNEGGRVLDSHDAGHKVGHYTAGWIKRGPSGVIGTNKKDALETVQHLLADVGRRHAARPAEPRARRRSRSCSPSAASATSASRTGRRSTRPRSAAASRTAAPGSSSSASRRCSRRSARRSPASAAWPTWRSSKAMIEAALPGAEVEVIDETGGRRPPAGDGQRAAVRGPLADRPAPAGQGRRQGALRRRHDPRPLA